MKFSVILFLCMSLVLETVHAQYKKAYEYAKQLEHNQDYYKAIITYNAANAANDREEGNDIAKRIAYCAGKLNKLRTEADSLKSLAQEATKKAVIQKQEIDSLYRLTKVALDRAEEMQQKVEVAMVDKAIKDHFKDWKGFDKYSLEESDPDSSKNGNKILNKVDSLDLSNIALLRIPKEVVRCHNLKYINLFGNPDIEWKASENTLRQLNSNVEINVSLTDLSEIDSTYRHFITGLEILPHRSTFIPQIILQQKQLKRLILNENELDILSPEIGSLSNLIELSLYRNNIRTLPAEIGKLNNLTQLDLRENKLTALPLKIGQLKNLRELDLDNNELTTLPVETGTLTELTSLSIINNNLKELPHEIGGLKNLSFLDLENNKLITLPSEIGKLTNLSKLFLTKNMLVTLPDEIGNLTNLNELSLYDNKLSNLPNEFWKLSNLSFLDLGMNKLPSLSPQIWNLKNLTELRLRSNAFNTLPPEIGKLTKLSSLSIEGNYFTGKPKVLGEMTNLTGLYLDESLLESIPEEIVKLKKITTLYIFGTEFSSLPYQIKELTRLTKLYIIGDSLINVPAEISGLKNLKELGFNIGSMSQVPPEIGKLTRLKRLNLIDTQIKSVPAELFNLNITAQDFFEIAQKLYKAKNYKQALKCYLKSIEIDSSKSNAYAFGNIGLCYRMLNILDSALVFLNKSLSFDEDNVWRLNQLSYTYARLNNARKAFEYSEKSNSIKTDIIIWNELGHQFILVNNYEQALRSYSRSLDIDSTKANFNAWSNIGLCYRLLKNPKKAVDFLNIALSFKEENIWCLTQLMLAHSELNEYSLAYLFAVKLTNVEPVNYSNWYNLSFQCLFVGKYDEGIKAAQKSLELAPDKLSVMTNLALGHVLNNQYDKAKPIYLEWKDKKFPDVDGFARDLFKKDIKDLENAKIVHPDFAKVYELLKE